MNVNMSDLHLKGNECDSDAISTVNIALFLRSLLFASRLSGEADNDTEDAMNLLNCNYALNERQMVEFVSLYISKRRDIPEDIFGFKKSLEFLPKDYLKSLKAYPNTVYSMAYILKCLIDIVEDDNNDISLNEEELEAIEDVKVEGFPEAVDEFVELTDRFIEELAGSTKIRNRSS